jgi:GNAT superfamily N-acetyltransferase
MSLLNIRTATIDDVPLILQFIRELADYEKLSHLVVADEPLLRKTLFGERAQVEVLIAEEGAQPAGFALFFHNFSTFLGRPGLYLEDLFIRPAFRGKGYGRAMMIHLARLAVARGCGRFEWWVLDWNEPAIRFYRSLGAVGMDEWVVQRVAGEALAALAGQPMPGE